MKVQSFIAAGSIVWLIGCSSVKFHPGDTCGQINATRCTPNNRVEICGPNGHWITAMDCLAMGSEWSCQTKDANHTCVQGPK